MYLYYEYYVNFDWGRKPELHGDSRNRSQGGSECGRAATREDFSGCYMYAFGVTLEKVSSGV